MTERDFEARLRAGFRQIGDVAAPAALRASVIAIPDVVPTAPQRRLMPGWRFPPMNRFAPIALAATAVVVVVVLIGIGLFVRSPEIGPSPIPGPTHSTSLEPSASSEPAVAAAWTVTGSMIHARVEFTATLLFDGRVLVTGGDRGYDAVPRALSSAELYDPATGAWTATGSMSTGRYRHTATLLPDGKVLVAGGNVNDSGRLGSACCLASAELYDPANGTWSATGSMIDARVAHSATLLNDGKVLVAGGASNSGTLDSTELYDPSSGTWTATGTMAGSYHHTALLLPDGRVLLGNGQVYDPSTGSWTNSSNHPDLNWPGLGASATLMGDGKMLMAGGTGYDWGADLGHRTFPLAAAAMYDAVSDTWTATGSMIAARGVDFTGTLLPDGKVLVVGGSTGSFPNLVLASAELYDPRTGTWTATATMGEGRYHQLAIRLFDGRVLVVGGASALVDSGFVLLPSAELYDPGSGS